MNVFSNGLQIPEGQGLPVLCPQCPTHCLAESRHSVKICCTNQESPLDAVPGRPVVGGQTCTPSMILASRQAGRGDPQLPERLRTWGHRSCRQDQPGWAG